MSDPQSEFVERYAERGPKGDKGETGARGKRGLPKGQARAAVSLLVLMLLLGGANLLFTARYVNDTVRASQKATVAVATATATAADQAALCRSANESRAQQISLWTFVIRLSRPPRTAQQRSAIARFERYLRAVFAPLPCPKEKP